MIFLLRTLATISLFSLATATLVADQIQAARNENLRFAISLPDQLPTGSVTGRIFLLLTKSDSTEPRLSRGPVSMFGADLHGGNPGEATIIDSSTPGCPQRSLGDLSPGTYYAQAVLNVYTEFHRADGYTVLAHMDQGEGQDFRISPGNLISAAQNVSIAANTPTDIKLSLNAVIPPIGLRPDTKWVKRIRIKSNLLSTFWGHPMYLSATVLLPKGYDDNSNIRYPVLYLHGHYGLGAPFGFEPAPDNPGFKSWARQRADWISEHPKESAAGDINLPEPISPVAPEPASSPASAEKEYTQLDALFAWDGSMIPVESGHEFYEAWNADNFPRVIAISCQYPMPYGDSAGAVNSANCGPYGDALMQEMIPYLEKHFRIINKPYARILTGCSWGGWISLALQVYHPDFYGGVWSFCPGFGVDFHRYQGVLDLYTDKNAYNTDLDIRFPGAAGSVQFTRDWDQFRSIVGPLYDAAVKTPIGPDGYPMPIWNRATGEIDQAVVRYMREHDYDLREYLQRRWPLDGPKLVGKLHLICGDEDGAYVQFGVYLLEDFLEGTKDPYYGGSFVYGRPMKNHCWSPTTNAELIRTMARFIAAHEPPNTQRAWWVESNRSHSDNPLKQPADRG
jgi:hypothetical protein